MNATMTEARPHAGLLAWLSEHKIEYELHRHDVAYTAQGVARAEGVDPRTFAKVIGVATDDGRRAFLVLDATDLLDLRKARTALMAESIRLLNEKELGELAPGCEIGAMPAVGSLFGLPMYADFEVREDPQISFNAGSHAVSVRVDREGWEDAAAVRYADLAADSDSRPAWARS
jgi:Ala-tRNA(Pro) deacylase